MGFDFIMFLVMLFVLVIIPGVGGWYTAKKYPGMGGLIKPPGWHRCECKDRYDTF